MSPADILASLEKLTGPSIEVDSLIADMFDPWPNGPRWPFSPGSKIARSLPRYTASLDAIVALIEQKLPREAKVIITHCVNMWLVSPAPIAELPRRLCIALLKALESGQ